MACSGWVRSCRKFDKNLKYLTRGPSTDDFSQYFTRVRVRESLVIWHGWWKSATFQWIPHSVRVKSTAFQSREKKIYQKTYSEYFFGDFFFLSIMWHWIRWINEYMSIQCSSINLFVVSNRFHHLLALSYMRLRFE